jgi:hypothetical protein
MALNNPKPKFINGSLYPNAKMTVSTDMNPYAGPHVNQTAIADVYSNNGRTKSYTKLRIWTKRTT